MPAPLFSTPLLQYYFSPGNKRYRSRMEVSST